MVRRKPGLWLGGVKSHSKAHGSGVAPRLFTNYGLFYARLEELRELFSKRTKNFLADESGVFAVFDLSKQHHEFVPA
jgi:hypothetical protein